jgi:hypothetical protein
VRLLILDRLLATQMMMSTKDSVASAALYSKSCAAARRAGWLSGTSPKFPEICCQIAMIPQACVAHTWVHRSDCYC